MPVLTIIIAIRILFPVYLSIFNKVLLHYCVLHLFSKYKSLLYNDHLPCYDFNSPLQPVEAVDLLLNTSPDDDSVCLSKPVGVQKALTFVVARRSLGSVDDIKADDLGAWIHKGKPVRKYRISRLDSGEVYGAELTNSDDDDAYKLTRIYYHHKSTPTFRRTLFYATSKLQLFDTCDIYMCVPYSCTFVVA